MNAKTKGKSYFNITAKREGYGTLLTFKLRRRVCRIIRKIPSARLDTQQIRRKYGFHNSTTATKKTKTTLSGLF
ncbi:MULTISPECIES: hypothetical protein [unclassified Clostridioides]|uniref:hypothetical protein n=1 Tax=unclassified Clostridioides TaxID=2635829 RepID=UPI001D11EC88|nr:hypothetical protein [Clostridioides sp. ZZV14-6150]MCC0667877.1 hypothetical protein [Clostridioides sp. ZZV14-6153]MCC0723688.1 hypothetical protein [Clostridioides sp. ZZV14-6104]MCC0724875.1 hypothetical protein [Clostridioides sp. ZZV14-6045]MCC0730753.1 hypothetical protein [Clostridioides sp. ZZV14-6048]MCC0736702.1 hypothetical protein [Clostridioides sp. ZZV14-6009]MCC0741491.1 hypothetical protein [Clostridioides sp. ZZV14-6044]MCC0751877.1 hypothetical protein [Clostridioides s